MTFNIGNADQNHAAAGESFGNVVDLVKALRLQGLDDARIIAQLTVEIGATTAKSLGAGDWDTLWPIIGALVFAALEKDQEQ